MRTTEKTAKKQRELAVKAFSRPGSLTDKEKTACAENFVDIYSRGGPTCYLQISESKSDGTKMLLESHANFIATVIGDNEEGIRSFGLEATKFFEAVTGQKN